MTVNSNVHVIVIEQQTKSGVVLHFIYGDQGLRNIITVFFLNKSLPFESKCKQISL